jgi:lipoprotein-releasing system permease protein
VNFLFAWRYFKAKKSTNAINIIAWVSVIAIILITAAFIILLSVFNGFEGLVKSLYSSFYTDIRITPLTGKVLKVRPMQLTRLRSIPEIKAFSLQVEEKSLLQNGEIQTIVFLKGVDEAYADVSGVPDKLIRGEFNTGTAEKPAVVLGSGIENALQLQTDRNLYPVTAYLFKRGLNINVIDPYQAFSAENVVTTGTFFIQQDIDNKYAITNVEFMKLMLGMKEDEYGSIEISLRYPGDAEQVKQQLFPIFPGNYTVATRYEQNKSLYSVMTLEKWAIYGILTLMLVVAAFTMIGALTMLVLEKRKDIQVLKSMGADSKRIQGIFLTEGLLLGVIGIVTGSILGLLICWAQMEFKLITIQGGTFLIDAYPVNVQFADIVLVWFTVLLIAFLASWFPSRKAAMEKIHLRS